MDDIVQTTFSNSILYGYCCNVIPILLKFVLNDPTDNMPALVQIMALRQ